MNLDWNRFRDNATSRKAIGLEFNATYCTCYLVSFSGVATLQIVFPREVFETSIVAHDFLNSLRLLKLSKRMLDPVVQEEFVHIGVFFLAESDIQELFGCFEKHGMAARFSKEVVINPPSS